MFAALTLLLVVQKDSGLTKSFADGSKASLVAITSLSAKRSWSAGGSALKDFVAPDSLKRYALGAKPGGNTKAPKRPPILVFKISGGRLGEVPSVAFKAGKEVLPNAFLYPDVKRGGWWAGAELNSKRAQVEVSVGVGLGTWHTLSTHDLQTGITKGPKFFAGILRNVASGKGKAISAVDATMPKGLSQDFSTRIKLFELGGGSPQLLAIGPITAGGDSRWQFVENDKRIVKAELQTRTYRWVTFSGVSVPKS